MAKDDDSKFLDNLNREIDRKIALIETGKMEPVTRLRREDFILSGIIIVLSLAAMIWAYFYMC